MNITVIFLSRFEDNGFDKSVRFIESYKKYQAGIEHDLIIISKGWERSTDYKKLVILAKSIRANILVLPDTGFDWGSYMIVVPTLVTDYVCFLNTNSYIISDNWLKILYSAIKNTNIGIAGATASWEIGPTRDLKNILILLKNSSKIRNEKNRIVRIIKIIWILINNFNLSHFFNAIFFPLQFPNYHIRSNAFITHLNLFKEYIKNKKMPKIKLDAYYLESGYCSLTRFIMKQGLNAVVVSKNGDIYFENEWNKSKTFRTSKQENAIIFDNHQKNYQISNKKYKLFLERITWGTN